MTSRLGLGLMDGFHDEVRSPDAQPGVGRMPTDVVPILRRFLGD